MTSSVRYHVPKGWPNVTPYHIRANGKLILIDGKEHLIGYQLMVPGSWYSNAFIQQELALMTTPELETKKARRSEKENRNPF
jgi:hypothetical protein